MKIRAKNVENGARDAVRAAAIAADTTVVLATPVDTGRARANWVTSVRSPVTKTSESTDPSGAAAIAQGTETIQGWKPGLGSIFIANSLPYIKRLNEGWSAQAPRGMTRQAIASARAELRKAGLLKPARRGGKL